MAQQELEFRYSNFAVFSSSCRNVSACVQRGPCHLGTHYPDPRSNKVIWEAKRVTIQKHSLRTRTVIKLVLIRTFFLWLRPLSISANPINCPCQSFLVSLCYVTMLNRAIQVQCISTANETHFLQKIQDSMKLVKVLLENT